MKRPPNILAVAIIAKILSFKVCSLMDGYTPTQPVLVGIIAGGLLIRSYMPPPTTNIIKAIKTKTTRFRGILKPLTKGLLRLLDVKVRPPVAIQRGEPPINAFLLFIHLNRYCLYFKDI